VRSLLTTRCCVDSIAVGFPAWVTPEQAAIIVFIYKAGQHFQHSFASCAMMAHDAQIGWLLYTAAHIDLHGISSIGIDDVSREATSQPGDHWPMMPQ
jgi:hypothetical protein